VGGGDPLRNEETGAICDYDAGYAVGQVGGPAYPNASGSPLKSPGQWGCQHYGPCLLRSEGFIDGLQSISLMLPRGAR